jgi:hypothetical protein
MSIVARTLAAACRQRNETFVPQTRLGSRLPGPALFGARPLSAVRHDTLSRSVLRYGGARVWGTRASRDGPTRSQTESGCHRRIRECRSPRGSSSDQHSRSGDGGGRRSCRRRADQKPRTSWWQPHGLGHSVPAARCQTHRVTQGDPPSLASLCARGCRLRAALAAVLVEADASELRLGSRGSTTGPASG